MRVVGEVGIGRLLSCREEEEEDQSVENSDNPFRKGVSGFELGNRAITLRSG